MALTLLAACIPFAETLPGTPTALPGLTPTAAVAGAVLAAGLWGGDHVSLMVEAGSAFVEFDCAHGSIPAPLAVDAGGRFAAAGTYVQEGGAMAQDPPPGRPAQYEGTLSGQTLTLTVITTDDNQKNGPFTLAFGQEPQLRKCQ
jgi:hypothetical protein